jgi:hypothetical protein
LAVGDRVVVLGSPPTSMPWGPSVLRLKFFAEVL